jgi:hypothetical protein
MPLNKLENFIKNYEGRILYVNSNDLDATDSITNQGNSLTKPFKTIQRALIEASRFSFLVGNNNDNNARTTILVFPGDHTIDNRPGYGIRQTGTALAEAVAPNGNTTSPASDEFTLNLESNFDITQEDNILYKFNSVEGGVIIPRGTSIVGLDLRKTRIRPKYVPNPTDPDVPNTAIFRVTGLCYFWQFSFFDGDESGLVYTNNQVFTSGSGNQSVPTFSHHKLTCFEYADGVNVPSGYNETDLDMYYAKLSNAFNEGSGRQIPAAQKFPLAPDAFAKERPEWEIVGAFAADPITISDITSGDGATPSPTITVTTVEDHGLNVGTPIKIRGINVDDYNISTTVATVSGPKEFTYLLNFVRNDLPADPTGSGTVTIETDTVKGASPYVFNCSLRSVWGMNGLLADGRKADGFRSMVLAQFTAVSLQKDDRAFVKYNPITRTYNGISLKKVTGAELSSGSASTNSDTVYHLDQDAVYRSGWQSGHVQQRNDSILQIVSVFAIGFNKHFSAESGADASITNSNSNFGQTALVADGFKKTAFDKDDSGYITSIITPRSIPEKETNVDWISIDVGLTTSVGISSHLYLFGFDSKDNVPPNLISGYRVGARENDKLYLDLPDAATVDIASAEILMTDSDVTTSQLTPTGSTSSKKEFLVSNITQAPSYEELVLSQNHNFRTGEKIIIISDDADLPEGIEPVRTYYVITTADPTRIKIASSFANASNDLALKMYGGSNLKIISRVTDRDSGEIGSPIQFDPNNNNWFVYTNQNSQIYNQIVDVVDNQGGFGEPRTDVTFFKRISDNRSIDEKIYKIRYVIPKEATGAKDPQEGFVLQESSTTGALTNSEFTLSTIDADDTRFERNPGFISTCSVASNLVTVITEQPHKLTVGDRVLVKNVKSSTNLAGLGITGYNGDFVVDSIVDTQTFRYSTTDRDNVTHNVGIFSGPTARDINLPRFERNDLESNFYIYRRDIISQYEQNVSDGIYHLYVLNASNAITEEFTDYEYEQNVTDLYPQLDRDNKNENPQAAKTFAKRFPLGDVQTNDLKKSITRESLDVSVKKFGLVPEVQSVTQTSVGVATITTTLNHGFNGIVAHNTLTAGSGFADGTYYAVRLFNENTFTTWNGASANITVGGGAITSVEIEASGSGYSDGDQLFFEGFAGASITVNSAGISSPVNNALQVTGLGTVTDGLYRISSIPSRNQVAIAKTADDPDIFEGQYLFNIGPSASVSTRVYDSTAGITTITTSTAHGLVAGNQLRILDSSDNNLGDFIVKDSVGITTFTVGKEISANADRVLKHGFNANNFSSNVDNENLGSRGVTFYGNEFGTLVDEVDTTSTGGKSTFAIVTNSEQGSVGVGTTARFPLGSFIKVNNEIMRVASSTLTGSGSNEITVIRASLGTQKQIHAQNSLIKKINPIPVELRRPSILRASGHTFEYLGYGPGNYSTGLPQVQVRTLTEKEDFLAQAQEKSAGQVVYTGMNSDGDFFIGNTKYSASSGKQQTFDIPIPTITGQDPSRLSVVFDEVIVKERILVEGGSSNQILSQFDGPVTFNENVIINDELKLTDNLVTTGIIESKNSTQSDSCTTGAIITQGGLGVQKNVNICGDLNVAGVSTFNGTVIFNTSLTADSTEGAALGAQGLEWAEGWIGGIGIATEGVAGGTEAADRTIRGVTGDLILGVRNEIDTDSGAVGYGTEVRIEDNLRVTLDTYLDRNLLVSGISTFQGLIDANDGANIDNITINDNTITTSSGPLNIDSATNIVNINATTNITGNTTFDDLIIVNTGIVPDTDEGAYVGVATLPFSQAYIGEIRIGEGSNDNKIDTVSGDLVLHANGNSDVRVTADTLIVDNGLNVSGVATFGNLLDANNGAHINNLRLGIDANNDITTSNGHLTLDSAGGTVRINDALTVDEASQFDGTVDIREDGNNAFRVRGDAGGHNAFRVHSGTSAATSATRVFGTLTVDGIATFDSTQGNTIGNVDTGAVQVDGGVGIAENLSVGGDFDVDGATTLDGTTVNGTLTVSGQADIDNIRINGNGISIPSDTNGNLNLSANGTGRIRLNNNDVRIAQDLEVLGNLDVDGHTELDNVNISGIVTATGFVGNVTGNATSADTVDTVATTSNNNHFLIFADSSSSTQGETMRVSPHFYLQPTNTASNADLFVRGDITAFAGAASDDRLKTNREIIPNALEKVLSLSGFTFMWNEKAVELGFVPEVSQVGVSAQQVQSVLPEAVKQQELDGEEILTVKYEKIVPILIEAIRELNAKVEDLEDKLSDK